MILIELLSLPDDLLISILSFLNFRELSNFCLISKKANQIANENYLWRVMYQERWSLPEDTPTNWKDSFIDQYLSSLSSFFLNFNSPPFLENSSGSRKYAISSVSRALYALIKQNFFTTYQAPNESSYSGSVGSLSSIPISPLLSYYVSHFLHKNTKYIHPKSLGTFLAENPNVCFSFIRLLPIGGIELDEDLKLVMKHITFPRQNSLVDKIIEQFSLVWFSSQPDLSVPSPSVSEESPSTNSTTSTSSTLTEIPEKLEENRSTLNQESEPKPFLPIEAKLTERNVLIKTPEQVHTIVYSLIVLTLDLHTPHVKVKMTPQQFVKGLELCTSVETSYLYHLYNKVSKSGVFYDGNNKEIQRKVEAFPSSRYHEINQSSNLDEAQPARVDVSFWDSFFGSFFS